MIFEYIRLTVMGDSASSLDFVSRVVFLIFVGLILTVAGFKIEGVRGAALFLAAGVILFLYNEGDIWFKLLLRSKIELIAVGHNPGAILCSNNIQTL